MNLNGLSSRDILQLLAVADEGSIRKAADRLGMTQPGLSRNIRTIEARLGISVFDRTPGGAVPTERGRMLLSRGRRILADLKQLQIDLQDDARSTGGVVKIGCGPMVAVQIVDRVIASCQAENAGLRIELDVALVDSLLPRLMRGELDFVIGAVDEPSLPAGFVGRVMQALVPEIYVRADHPLTRVSPVPLRDLKTSKWAFVHVPKAFGSWICQKLDVDALDVAFQCDDLDMLASVVAGSDMVSCASRPVIDVFAARLPIVALPVVDLDYVHTILCVELQTKIMTRPAQTVLKAIERIMGDFSQGKDQLRPVRGRQR